MSDTTTFNELENLRTFLKEALLRMDPSLDVSAGSPAEMEVITPTIERLAPDPYDTPIATFIKERLRSQFPDLLMQDNDALDDYAVKINRVLLEPFRRQIALVSKNQSLQAPDELNEDEADKLAANFFVRRRLGGFSVGVARLYFSAPQQVIVAPANPVFTAGGLRFFPVENQAITSTNMQLNVEGGLYYFDTVVRAESVGSDYDINIDDGLVGIEGLSQVVKVVNKSAFEEGADKESTEEFVERVENSLSERSLVTARGVHARLLDVFQNVRSVQVVGFGDIEMERDIITGGSDFVYGIAQTVNHPNFGSYPDILQATSFKAVDVGTADYGDYGQVGDKLILLNNLGSTEYTVTSIEGVNLFKVSPVPDAYVVGYGSFSRAGGPITLSDIPGGIVDPETSEGTITVVDGEVHIGGALDVFVRAGFPQQRSTTVESIRDAEPLHFGIDLESFAESYDNPGAKRFINITGRMTEAVISGGVASPGDFELGELDILIPKDSPDWDWNSPPVTGKPEMIWVPSAEDVGRFVQFDKKAGKSSSIPRGTFEITAYRGYGSYEFQSKNFGAQTVKGWVVTVSGLNVELPVDPIGPPVNPAVSLGQTDSNVGGTGDFDTLRVREKVSMAPVVRDRDASRAPAGVNFDTLGVEIGDSLIIEAGDDAGIYTIRRLLTMIDTNDALLLSQDLTRTVHTSGSGNGSGHRYRIADELNINLIEPRTTKIPQGAIFTGSDLVTTAGSQIVTLTGGGDTDFELAGVTVNDTLEILTGDSARSYTIQEVYADSLKVTPETPATTFDSGFSIYTEFTALDRPLVRVKDVQLLDSSSQETGISIPFGDYIDARARGVFSNQGRGDLAESYTGQTTLPSTLTDVEVDFVAEGVQAGDRLTILDDSNAGEYEVTSVATNSLGLRPAASGGKDLWTVVTAPAGVHYTVGGASVGWVRMYFLEPTTITLQTGPLGGRLRHQVATDSYQDFRFSAHDGHLVLPAGGSGDDDPRDLRVIHSQYAGSDYETVLELVGPNTPDAFDLELQAGDVMEVFEPIPFRDNGSAVLGYGELFNATGLKTVAGSNVVEIPECSAIDFEEMNDSANDGPIVGQLLYIDNGPDEGRYTITEVVTPKQLRLSSVMASTTQAWLAQDNSTPGDGELDASDPIQLSDVTDNPSTGAAAGQYITIFEVRNPDFQSFGGTFAIDSVQISYLELTDHPEAGGSGIIGIADGFRWLRTAGNTNVFQPFSIYKSVPTELPILQVATVEPEVISGGPAEIQLVSGKAALLVDTAVSFSGVSPGDMVEIVHSGDPYNPDQMGVYHASTVIGTTSLEVHHNAPFESVDTNVYYRIWGGPFGSRRLITVDGHVLFGTNIPFRIRRPGVLRVSSTEMEDNFDGALYYVDAQVESLGGGDALNIEKDERLEVTSGLAADGYTYEVENNTLTFSPYEEVSLKFDRRFLPAGNSDLPENLTEITARNLQITAEVSSTVRAINDLMRSDTERPVNANPIARHVLPSYVHATMVYRGGSAQSIVGQEIEDYINQLGALDELEVSDVERFIQRRGAHSIDHPIELVTVTHDLDRNLIVDRSYNALGGTDVAYNGTGRISSFFAKIGEGLNITRES